MKEAQSLEYEGISLTINNYYLTGYFYKNINPTIGLSRFQIRFNILYFLEFKYDSKKAIYNQTYKYSDT